MELVFDSSTVEQRSEGTIEDKLRNFVSCPARVKALNPLTSTCPPDSARIVEYDEQEIKLEASRYFPPGTLLQLRVERTFSLWKVRDCAAHGALFYLGAVAVECV